MNKKFLVTLFVLALTTDLSVGFTKPLTKRGIEEYGPPVHISSSVLSFKQNEGILHEEADTAEKLLQGEWSRFEVEGDNPNLAAEIGSHLKFVGVVGSGYIYVPEGETENHFGHINYGLVRTSQWS